MLSSFFHSILQIVYELQDSVSLQGTLMIYNATSCLICLVSTFLLTPTKDELLKYIADKGFSLSLDEIHCGEDEKLDSQKEQISLLNSNLKIPEISKCHSHSSEHSGVNDVGCRSFVEKGGHLGVESFRTRRFSKQSNRNSLNFVLYSSVTSLSSYTLAFRCQKVKTGKYK